MQQTTIPNKVAGQTLSANEFNELNNTVNSNSDFATGAMDTLGDGIPNLESRLTIIEDTNTSDIQVYHTLDLPTGLTNGAIAFDSSSEVPVYTVDDAWYRSSDDAPIDSFAEADLFIVMGQSNADGKAEYVNLDPNLQATDRSGVLIHKSTINHDTKEYEEGAWEQIDPGVNTSTANGRFGPELGLADLVLEYINDDPNNGIYEKPPAIMKMIKGNTSLEVDWASPSGDCYEAMIQDIPNAKFDLGQLDYKFDIRAIIWHQGESDAFSETDADNYEFNLTEFISDVRTRFNKPELPVVLCKIWYTSSPPAYITEVRNAMDSVAAADANVYVVETSDFSFRDNVHLDAQGMYDLGQRIGVHLANI